MKKILIAFFAFVFALAPLSVRAADPYEINVILSMSGYGAFLGQQQAAALKGLQETENKKGGINGRPIQFNVVDDASSPVNAVQLANQIIAKKVPVILGSSLAADCEAIAGLVKANGPVQYCLSPAIHPAAGSFSFSAGASTSDISTAAIRYFRERGLTRIALISSTDASGADGENVVLHSLSLPENKGVTLVTNEHFGIADVSVGAQVARIKAANPQVVIAWTSGTPTGTVLHALHDAGIDVPVLLNAANIVRAQLKGYAAFAPTDLVLPGFLFMAPEMVTKGPVHDAQQAFFAALATQNISTPEVTYSLAYDPALVVINVLRKLGPNPTAVQVREAIEQYHGVAGVNSMLDFRDGSQRGVPINAIVIIRWDGAKETFVPVSAPGGDLLKK